MYNVVIMVRYYYILALINFLQACELSQYTVTFHDDDCDRQKIISINVSACRGNCFSESKPSKKMVSAKGVLVPEKSCKCCTMVEWEVRPIAIKKCRRGDRKKTKTINYETMSAVRCACQSCVQEYTVRNSNYLNSRKHARSAGMDLEEDYFSDERSHVQSNDRSHDQIEEGTSETLKHSSEAYDLNVLR